MSKSKSINTHRESDELLARPYDDFGDHGQTTIKPRSGSKGGNYSVLEAYLKPMFNIVCVVIPSDCAPSTVSE